MPLVARYMARCVFLILLLLTNNTLAAEETDWKKGKLQHLSKYIGTYQIEAVLNDPHVNRALKAYLGPRYAHLVRNLEVRGSIDMIANDLVITGGRAHETHKESACVTVAPYDGEVNVAIHSQGKILLFSKKEHYAYLPESLRFWIYQVNIEDTLVFSTPPPNLTWMKNK